MYGLVMALAKLRSVLNSVPETWSVLVAVIPFARLTSVPSFSLAMTLKSVPEKYMPRA